MAQPVPSETLATMSVWFNLSDALSESKVKNFAALLERSGDELFGAFKDARLKHQVAEQAKTKRERIAALVKDLSGICIYDLSQDGQISLGVAIELGIPVRLTMEMTEDGQKVPCLACAPPAEMKGSRQALVVRGSPKQFLYFHNGENCGVLAQHILREYPESVAAASLRVYKDKVNKSKLSAWVAVTGDEDLKGLYTREEVA